MLYRHANKRLARLEEDPAFNAGFAENIVEGFRRRMQQVAAAENENDLRALKSLHFEKLRGDRQGQYSIRINAQFRLVFGIEKGKRSSTLVILAVEDYH